jgi:hypothetical protein
VHPGQAGQRGHGARERQPDPEDDQHLASCEPLPP